METIVDWIVAFAIRLVACFAIVVCCLFAKDVLYPTANPNVGAIDQQINELEHRLNTYWLGGWLSPFQYHRDKGTLDTLRLVKGNVPDAILKGDIRQYATRAWPHAVWLTLLITFIPVCHRLVWYVIADAALPYLRQMPAIDAGQPGRNADIQEPVISTCSIVLAPERPLAIKDGWLLSYPPHVERHTRLLWDYRHPITSLVSRLVELTVVSSHQSDTTITIASKSNPHVALLVAQLTDHPGMVVRPKSIVAISPELKVFTRWFLTQPHAWLLFRLRSVIVSGSGIVVFRGNGGLRVIKADGGQRISLSHAIAYDARTSLRACPTETFWPYLRGNQELFDEEFAGPGHVLCETTLGSESGPTFRTWTYLLEAIGKVFGF